MDQASRFLRARQLDRSLAPFPPAQAVVRPPRGWLRAVRQASGLSASALARSLGVSRHLPLQLEKAEAEERITLASLRKMAHAMDCELVYAIVPKEGTVQQLQERRARRQAHANVMAVERSMALEDQSVANLEEAIELQTQRILRKPSAR